MVRLTYGYISFISNGHNDEDRCCHDNIIHWINKIWKYSSIQIEMKIKATNYGVVHDGEPNQYGIHYGQNHQ